MLPAAVALEVRKRLHPILEGLVLPQVVCGQKRDIPGPAVAYVAGNHKLLGQERHRLVFDGDLGNRRRLNIVRNRGRVGRRTQHITREVRPGKPHDELMIQEKRVLL